MRFTPTEYSLLKYNNLTMLIFSILSGIGYIWLAGFWPPPPAHLNAADIAAFYRDNSFGIRLGMLICLTGIPLYMMWGVGLSKIIEKMEGGAGILSRMELAGTISSSIILAVPLVVWLLPAFRADIRPDAEIQLFYDFGWMLFDLPILFFGVQYISAGVAILTDKREQTLFPSWLAWLGFAATFSFVSVLMIPFLTTGPFAWHGIISFWVVFTIFFVYLLVFMAMIPQALRRLAAEDAEN